MKIHKLLLGLVVVILLQSCAVKKLTTEGEAAYMEGNYTSALDALGEVIEKRENAGKKAQAEIYYMAGISAYELGNFQEAREYLEAAEREGYSSPDLFASLASIYQQVDNLSKEITALESYKAKFPGGENIDTITTRLFETYVESENWKLAYDLWTVIEDQAMTDVGLMEGYLKTNKQLENNKISDEMAVKILEMDPENITALQWNANKYFWMAENMYVTEMKAYKNNRTRSQYKKLLKAWDKIWPYFRQSRDYYKKLYYIQPDPMYAEYLETIYKRMDKPDKVAFWREKVKK